MFRAFALLRSQPVWIDSQLQGIDLAGSSGRTFAAAASRAVGSSAGPAPRAAWARNGASCAPTVSPAAARIAPFTSCQKGKFSG